MFLQDCKLSVQQQGSEFVLNDGFDVIFSLLQEYHKSATTDMKQLGEHNGVRGYNEGEPQPSEISYNFLLGPTCVGLPSLGQMSLSVRCARARDETLLLLLGAPNPSEASLQKLLEAYNCISGPTLQNQS